MRGRSPLDARRAMYSCYRHRPGHQPLRRRQEHNGFFCRALLAFAADALKWLGRLTAQMAVHLCTQK
jgi:hypothetical protein